MSGNVLRLPLQQRTAEAGFASWKIGVALCAIGMLSRWLLRGRLIYDQETAALAFAAIGGDHLGGIATSPTGALYIALGRQLIALLGTPELAFVAISVVASGLAVVMLYLLGAAIFGEVAGVLSAALLMSSPLFWFYGAVGLPYACDVLIAAVAAWLSWRLASGRGQLLPPLALWLALAAGLRPWSALLMLPLAIFAATQAKRLESLRRAHLAGALLAGSPLGAIWLLPVGWLSGAPLIVGALVAFPPDLGGLARTIGWGWGLAILPALGLLPLWALRLPGFRASYGRWGWLHDPRLQFLAAWGAPWLLLAALSAGDPLGQPAPVLPILMLWSARALVCFIGAGTRRLAIIAATLAILGNAALFLALPEQRMLGSHRAPSAATIFYRDRRLAAAIVTIRSFSPSETVILADDWLPVRFYLPSYPLIPFRHAEDQITQPVELSAEQRELARRSAALIWFEASLDRYNTSPSEIESQPMAIGALRILRPHPAEELVVGQAGFGLRAKPR